MYQYYPASLSFNTAIEVSLNKIIPVNALILIFKYIQLRNFYSYLPILSKQILYIIVPLIFL